jgi:hypothetical protein
MFLIIRLSSSKLFASAFDSAFFKRRVMNLTDFSGQRPVTGCECNTEKTGDVNRTLRRLELLRLAGTADATIESPERDDLFVLRDVAEVCVCLG